MRAFIGIDFGEVINQEILAVQNKLKTYSDTGRWKPVDNFHLTLKFLGEVSSTQLIQIHDSMKIFCASKTPFDLSVSGLWTFDGKDSIRVLWLGVSGDLDKLRSIQADIDEALLPIGFQSEKRGFAPHVTIGQDIVFKTDFKQIQNELGNIQLSTVSVQKLFLYESEEVDHKRFYRKIAEYALPADQK